jgi:Small subunit of phenylpropionate dioxygenase
VTGEIMTAPTDQQLIDFVIRETRLIDQHRFEEWLDLFAEDGFYWMPLEWGQTDPRLTTSLMYEDKLLLKIRVERLKGNRTFSQKPKEPLPSRAANAAGRQPQRGGERVCYVDADALCRDAARPAGPLRRLGHAYARRWSTARSRSS